MSDLKPFLIVDGWYEGDMVGLHTIGKPYEETISMPPPMRSLDCHNEAEVVRPRSEAMKDNIVYHRHQLNLGGTSFWFYSIQDDVSKWSQNKIGKVWSQISQAYRNHQAKHDTFLIPS